MSYNFRDDAPLLGSNAQIELPYSGTSGTPVKMQVMETVGYNAVAAPSAGSISLFINPPAGSASLPSFGQYSLAGVSVTFSTASTSGTLDVFKDTNTTAPGAGATCLTGTISLAGTANTTVNGTLLSSATALQLAAGDRLTLKFGGTLTNLANLCVNLYIIRTV